MILGIDTTTPRLSLALSLSQNIIEKNILVNRRHGEVLLVEIDNLFKSEAIKFKDLEGIVVGLGPGSFTGTRVGIAAALGIAQALQIPIVGISSFKSIAANYLIDMTLIIENARQNRVYAALYTKKNYTYPVVIRENIFQNFKLLEELPQTKIGITGPYAESFYKLIPELYKKYLYLLPNSQEQNLPSAKKLIELARDDLKKTGMSLDQITPIYIRATQAEENLNKLA